MTYYVADTHAFLWYLTNGPQLSKNAREAFDLADSGKAVIILPAIVLLECIDVIDKKKVALEFQHLLLRLTHASNFMLAEMNWALILETSKVRGFKDLHDRIIIATAQSFGASLISKDKLVAKYYPKIVW